VGTYLPVAKNYGGDTEESFTTHFPCVLNKYIANMRETPQNPDQYLAYLDDSEVSKLNVVFKGTEFRKLEFKAKALSKLLAYDNFTLTLEISLSSSSRMLPSHNNACLYAHWWTISFHLFSNIIPKLRFRVIFKHAVFGEICFLGKIPEQSPDLDLLDKRHARLLGFVKEKNLRFQFVQKVYEKFGPEVTETIFWMMKEYSISLQVAEEEYVQALRLKGGT